MTEKASFRIRDATKEDVPRMAWIRWRAFGTNGIHGALWPAHLRVNQEKGGDHLAYLTTRMERQFREKDSWLYYIVAVQDTASGEEAIAGCAEWYAPEPAGQEPKAEKSLEERLAQLPAAINKAAVMEHTRETEKLEEAAQELLGGKGSTKDMWWPNSVAVDPDFQGNGIGTLLAQWGVDQADKDGKDVYLLASSAGARLYRKLGFTDLCDSEYLGERHYAMVKRRAPAASQSET